MQPAEIVGLIVLVMALATGIPTAIVLLMQGKVEQRRCWHQKAFVLKDGLDNPVAKYCPDCQKSEPIK